MNVPASSRVTATTGVSFDSPALLRRGSLLAVLFVSAMIPWYTLHLFPVITMGAAKINVLDLLAACTVLLALPVIIRQLLSGRWILLGVCVFIAYMLIPLAVGLRDPQATFFAIRESRALAFYALALVFAAGGYQSRDFRAFAIAYVIGVVAAIAAVFAHINGFIPLPGYPPQAVSGPAYIWWSVRYLEWTVPVVAFLLSLATALSGSTRLARLPWGAASAAIAWYVLATNERFLQFLIVATEVVVISLPTFGSLKLRLVATVGAVVVVAAVLGFPAVNDHDPPWLTVPVKGTLYRWMRAGSDSSLRDRVEELGQVVPRLVPDPLFGEGLGGPVLPVDPHNPGHPWPYASSGYAFLLIKTGLIGLGLYIGMVGTALHAGWRVLRARTDPDGWPTLVTGMIGIGLLLTLNVLYPTVDTPEGAVAFSLFYGMLASKKTA